MEIIAEAGSNHNGSIEDALRLVNLAARANAASVKFQFIFPEGLYVPKYYNNGEFLENEVFKQREREQLEEAEWRIVWKHCEDLDLPVFASVFCSKGVELLKSLGSKTVKVASTDLNNHELIAKCLENFDRCIISTGMATLSEIHIP